MTNKVFPQLLSAAPLIPSLGRNIFARTNSVTPNTKIDASADYFTVIDSSNNVRLLSSLSGTVDFGTVGANGMDTGTQQASTWYYIYAIAKEDGTKALLGSASATSPTLPSGYSYFGLISAARSDGSTHFIPFRQYGAWNFYETRQNILNNGSATTETSITTSAAYPSVAQLVSALWSYTNGTNPSDCTLKITTGTSFAANASNQSAVYSRSSINFPNTGNLYYQNGAASGACSVDIMGFKLPISGE